MSAKTLADYFNDRKFASPPFESTGSSILLAVDFRDQTAAEAALAANGFVNYATTDIWDDTLGWNPNQSGGWGKNDWVPAGYASRADAFSTEEATIYIEVERDALSCTWMDDDTFFTDSQIGPSASCWDGSTVVPADHLYGDYTVANLLGYAFRTIPAAGSNTLAVYYQVGNDAGNPTGRLNFGMHDGISQEQVSTRGIGRTPDLDCFDDFAQIAYTMKGNVLRVYLDGDLIRRFKMASSFTVQDLFYRVSIGSSWTTTRALAGNIRRFQIANESVGIDVEGPRMAFISDSITQNGANTATPNDPDVDTATVAQIDAVQNGLYESSLDFADDVRINPIISSQWRPWIHELSRVAGNYALPFQFYCSGAAGRGWSDTDPIPQAFIDAVIAYDPEIIVATGSPNDIDGVVVPDYLNECKAKIDLLIGGCRNVRKFLFFETWPSFKGKANHATQPYIDEYHRQRGLQADLDGYTVANASGEDVFVEFVPTYEKIGGDDYPADFNIGGSQYAALWDSHFGQSLSMTDLHMAQFGHDLAVPIYWNAVKPYLLNAVVR